MFCRLKLHFFESITEELENLEKSGFVEKTYWAHKFKLTLAHGMQEYLVEVLASSSLHNKQGLIKAISVVFFLASGVDSGG